MTLLYNPCLTQGENRIQLEDLDLAKFEDKTVCCDICKQQKRLSEVTPAIIVRSSIGDLIKKEHPEWSSKSFICHKDLDQYRSDFVQKSLEEEKGELTELEDEVVRAMKEQELLSKNLNEEFEQQQTFGERIADKVADFGGSWAFIISFGILLAIWFIGNSAMLIWHGLFHADKAIDPYPFMFMNLVLSCLAAVQAPVIMMSQNRQEAKDRLRAENDYKVNLRAELEIRNLGQKIDHLLHQEWQRLLEIQEIQTDLMEEMAHKNSGEETTADDDSGGKV
jgi:uncharacterized membrane protein